MPEMIGNAMKTPAVDFADTEPSERILLENLPAYVLILSSDARVEYINRAGSGCHVRDVIGRLLNDFLSKKSRETAAKCIQSALRDGATSECEVVDVNGLVYLARCSPMVNGEARSSVLVVATDITTHKRAEAEIRQSEQKYRELVENIHDVIFSVDREGVLTFISHAIAAISGYQPSELVGRPYRELIHPDDYAEVRAGFGAMLEGKGEPSEYRLMSKDGQYRWVRSHSRPISVDNVVVGVQGVLSDVTERRRTEGALREAEGRYRSMFENAVLGIYHSTPDGRFLDVNHSLVSMLGYDSAEELTAMDIADALYVDPNEREKLVARIRGDETFDGIDVEWKTKQGDAITARLSGRVLRNEAGGLDGFEVIAEDITEKQAMEEQYRQSQKMEAIGRLAGGVAHDFNNLLTVINGNAELALSTLDASDASYDDLIEIKKAGERAADLTTQLLAFSRRQIVQPAVVGLNEVISESAEMLRRIIGEDIVLETRLGEELGNVLVDRSQVGQVIMNLAVNARDAMPRGGRVILATRNVTLEVATPLEQATMPPGRYVAMSCEDTGCGIEENIRQHIFEPFFTTKEESRGTGLGLSTVYGSVQQAGGFIEVASELGEGSCFTVYFPEVSSLPEVASPVDGIAPELPVVGNVLIVEDDAAVRLTAVQMLAKCGYTVFEARNAEEAMRLFEARREPFSLLITDVVMPGMSGPELADTIKNANPETRVLYMTGYADEEVLSESFRNRKVVLLKKPFSLGSIIEKIGEALKVED